jgi:hypothetical protein
MEGVFSAFLILKVSVVWQLVIYQIQTDEIFLALTQSCNYRDDNISLASWLRSGRAFQTEFAVHQQRNHQLAKLAGLGDLGGSDHQHLTIFDLSASKSKTSNTL